jgi:hypothetical protein
MMVVMMMAAAIVAGRWRIVVMATTVARTGAMMATGKGRNGAEREEADRGKQQSLDFIHLDSSCFFDGVILISLLRGFCPHL